MSARASNDYSISLVRFLATVAIIICHMLQYFDKELMWWFNVGVQIFLCISGYLYGRKGLIDDDFKFYKKNFSKILLDYYIVTIPMFILLTIFVADKFSIIALIKTLFTKTVMKGGEHLWYIPYCIICYFLTPLLSRYFERNKNKHIVLKFVLLGFIVTAIIEMFFQFFTAAWFLCYLLGYFLGHLSLKGKTRLYNTVCIIIVIFALISNTLQIILDYVVKLELNDANDYYYARMCKYAHVALGTSIFLFCKKLFSAIFKNGYPKPLEIFCKCSDRYSYDIYLVHQFVILGPLSLMALTPMLPLNIVIIVAIILVSAVAVNIISKFLQKPLNKLLKI